MSIPKCGIRMLLSKDFIGYAQDLGILSFLSGGGDIIWRLVPFAVLWSIWKERNDRIFRGVSSSLDELMSYVIL